MSPRYFAKWERLAAVDIAPMNAHAFDPICYAKGTAHASGTGDVLTHAPAPWAARSRSRRATVGSR